ncbi:hypothetical protein MTR67_019158 [Solanum verrucosum]|uniref:Uncharacterized protein n=1 Tax=Solanum verrucosum TaxID=315347 RepID=A0AAF0QNY9_SOLVR|nr:hypothetical protein MTR67_019158 [Solanum verrucosum]
MDAKKKYYRIDDIPLAMQVWLYECCSVVDLNIAEKKTNRIPRLVNWRTRNNIIHYEFLMEGMFSDNDSLVKDNVQGTYHPVEIHIQDPLSVQKQSKGKQSIGIPSLEAVARLHCPKIGPSPRATRRLVKATTGRGRGPGHDLVFRGKGGGNLATVQEVTGTTTGRVTLDRTWCPSWQ